MTAKHYFLDKTLSLREVALVSESRFERQVRPLEGPQKGKILKVHPKGVAWGRIFPRVFTTYDGLPPSVHVIQGRVVVRHADNPAFSGAVPESNPHYRFQPFIADVIDSMIQRQSVVLTGGTGVGKTSHVCELFARMNRPLLRINFNGETRMSDLVGKVQVIDGETRWLDGVLPMAMRRGWGLLLDELDFADPSVLSLLHPVLEENPILVLKENGGEILKPHPDFRLFATANSIGAMQDRSSAYAGTNTMNQAFLDRLQVLLVPSLSEKEEARVLRDAVPELRSSWAKRIAAFAAKARLGGAEGGIGYSGDNFSTRKCLAWAKKAALHRSLVKGARLAWLDTLPASEQESMEKGILAFCGSSGASRPRRGTKVVPFRARA